MKIFFFKVKFESNKKKCEAETDRRMRERFNKSLLDK